MSASNATTPVDPWTQLIPLIVDASGTVDTFSLADLDDFINYGIRICINYASQVGATVVLLVVLLLITRDDKRTSPIFLLNAAGLALDASRNILQCLYFTGPFYSFYAQRAGDFSHVPASQYRISIAGIVLTFLLLVALEASLVLQVRAVCVTLPRRHRRALTPLGALVALLAVAFRFAVTVTNAIAVVALDDYVAYYWLAAASNYVTMASIVFFSAVFVAKLAVALRQRRRMGLRAFGPIQVIFIMGCQTLMVPGTVLSFFPSSRLPAPSRLDPANARAAVFSILQNFTVVPELGSQTLTLVALFLPLSALWAAAALPASASPAAGQHRAAHTGGSSSAATEDAQGEAEKDKDTGGFQGWWRRGGAGRGDAAETEEIRVARSVTVTEERLG